MGNTTYESYDRGTEKNAWVFGPDGKTPLLGEVGCRRGPPSMWTSQLLKAGNHLRTDAEELVLMVSP